MTPYKKRSCPITKRLAEDLMIRNMADATIDAYTYHVRRLADFIKKPLDRVTRKMLEPSNFISSKTRTSLIARSIKRSARYASTTGTPSRCRGR